MYIWKVEVFFKFGKVIRKGKVTLSMHHKYYETCVEDFIRNYLCRDTENLKLTFNLGASNEVCKNESNVS